jgi:hypothetical protein
MGFLYTAQRCVVLRAMAQLNYLRNNKTIKEWRGRKKARPWYYYRNERHSEVIDKDGEWRWLSEDGLNMMIVIANTSGSVVCLRNCSP